jgi:hypothetical protein
MTDIHEKPRMTVGSLRKVLKNLPDDMPVEMEIETEGDTDLAQAGLRSADVEARCDEIDRLYLWGSADVDAGDDDTLPPPPDSTRRPVA